MPAASSRSQTHNPYVSPRAGGDARGEASSVDIFSAVSAFEVGDKEKHDVRVRWSLWSGEEVYMVDGEEVMRMRSFDSQATFSQERVSKRIGMRVRSGLGKLRSKVLLMPR